MELRRVCPKCGEPLATDTLVVEVRLDEVVVRGLDQGADRHYRYAGRLQNQPMETADPASGEAVSVSAPLPGAPSRATEQPAVDWRGWSAAIFSGILAGIVIGWDPSHMIGLGAAILGALVGVLTISLAGTQRFVKAVIADAIMVAACLPMFAFTQWSVGRWPVGHLDSKTMFLVGFWLTVWGFIPGVLVSLVTAVIRRTSRA